MTETLLSISHLDVHFRTSRGDLWAVRDVSLDIARGQRLAIVGESGSGKSTVLLAALGLLPASATVTGQVHFDGMALIGASQRTLGGIRGRRIGMIFQDPMTSLNPALTIGDQLAEAIQVHRKAKARQLRERCLELLEMVSISAAAKRLHMYPHELSGGMRQRVMIAMSMANDPDLLIADEPTTALDVTVQAQILDVLSDVCDQTSLSVAFVTHDLGVVAGFASDVCVMYGGRIVESGTVWDVFDHPEHPYTQGLFGCLPRLDLPQAEITPIGGQPPSLTVFDSGCAFAARCPSAFEPCRSARPALVGERQSSACFLRHEVSA